MSADLLREAAAKMRDEWADADLGIRPTAFYLAVADWLDAEADEIPPHATHYRDGPIDDAPAVRVARAYLGSDQ